MCSLKKLPERKQSDSKSEMRLSAALFSPLKFFCHPTGQHHPDHFVVTHERPERILKCGGFVFLDEEMAYPGGAVSGNQGEWKQPPPTDRDEKDDTSEREGGADEVQQTSARLAVFGDVVWPKLSERVVLTLRH